MNQKSSNSHITWIKRARVWLAGAALACLAVAGGLVVSAPEAPEADEQAGFSWSFRVVNTDDGGKWAGTQGVTWS